MKVNIQNKRDNCCVAARQQELAEQGSRQTTHRVVGVLHTRRSVDHHALLIQSPWTIVALLFCFQRLTRVANNATGSTVRVPGTAV